MATKEPTIAREGGVSKLSRQNAISSRTRAYGGTIEQSVNKRAANLARQYASWNNPLRASDWNIQNAYRIARAVERMLKK